MMEMTGIADLLFEARMLKQVNRSGYKFLGTGKETVAEHSFLVTFIAYVMAQMVSGIDSLKLITMSLVHDLAEARTGDLNTVQKYYVDADETRAVADLTETLFFGSSLSGLVEEFNAGETEESKLARDADQLSFIIDLKAMKDMGFQPSEKWLASVMKRLKTEIGREIAKGVMEVGWDQWWQKNYLDISEEKD